MDPPPGFLFYLDIMGAGWWRLSADTMTRGKIRSVSGFSIGASMVWDWLIERRIQEAQKAGEFENLPGAGKPLQLREHPHSDPAWQMAYHLLENAGHAPLWVEMTREARRDLEKAREDWRQACLHWPEEDSRRSRAERRFERRIAKINKQIEAINLSVPLPAFQWSKLDPAVEKLRIVNS